MTPEPQPRSTGRTALTADAGTWRRIANHLDNHGETGIALHLIRQTAHDGPAAFDLVETARRLVVWSAECLGLQLEGRK